MFMSCRRSLVGWALGGILLLTSPLASAGQAPAMSRAQREQLEAAQHYERGRVFFQQGAYKEAEQAFRQAEKKDEENLEYQLAAAATYLRLHRPDDALKRYNRIYKKDPTHLRAMAGIAESYEERQHYRDAAQMWRRYLAMDLEPAAREDATRRLEAARELFARHYEIQENPGGGAANAATAAQEREWGQQFAQELRSSGIPDMPDPEVTAYVRDLCERLVPVAKGFPRQYQLAVLDSPTVNAQTTPGYIFVYRGLLELVTSEAELVGVLAHEMGHTIGHHAGKAVTKATQDAQTLKQLQSGGGFSKFLAALAAVGNPLGQLSFSRDQEAQADRLGIHITFDAGYDPLALASLFQKFEAMSPSSRKSWDLMLRTHPFSLDRFNAVRDYAPLLPERPLRSSSPEFDRMKERLRRLPPSPEPRPVPQDVSSNRGDGQLVIPYTLDNAPFAGEIPATWTARKTPSGTIIFEGQPGTDAHQATVELELAPRANLPGRMLADVADMVVQGVSQKAGARVEPAEARTDGNRSAYAVRATYSLQADRGMVAVRHLSVVLEYPDYFIILSYYAPVALFERFLPEFQGIGDAFRYTGR